MMVRQITAYGNNGRALTFHSNPANPANAADDKSRLKTMSDGVEHEPRDEEAAKAGDQPKQAPAFKHWLSKFAHLVPPDAPNVIALEARA